MALALDTFGFYLSPSVYLALFGLALGSFLNFTAIAVFFYAATLVWFLIQLVASLSLFPNEIGPLFQASLLISALLMTLTTTISVMQVFTAFADQGPLIAGVGVYGLFIALTAARYDGWKALQVAAFGGFTYVLFLPTFYVTFLLYSVARYDTTSWR